MQVKAWKWKGKKSRIFVIPKGKTALMKSKRLRGKEEEEEEEDKEIPETKLPKSRVIGQGQLGRGVDEGNHDIWVGTVKPKISLTLKYKCECVTYAYT